MSITLTEKNNDYYYNEKKILFGNELIKYVYMDFSNLYKTISLENHSKTYKDFFDSIFELEYNSIYYQLLRNTLSNFYDLFDNSQHDEIPFPYSEIKDREEFVYDLRHFFSPLFRYQRKIKGLLDCILEGNENLEQNILNLYKKDNSIFDFSQTDTPTIYETFEVKNNLRINVESLGKYTYTHSFTTIQELCFFELKTIFENEINISKCEQCHDFYIKKHGNNKFCSTKCKELYNKSHIKILYKLYRKKYKILFNTYSTYKDKKEFPKKELLNLYLEYKEFDTTQDLIKPEIVDEFTRKLNNIK